MEPGFLHQNEANAAAASVFDVIHNATAFPPVRLVSLFHFPFSFFHGYNLLLLYIYIIDLFLSTLSFLNLPPPSPTLAYVIVVQILMAIYFILC